MTRGAVAPLVCMLKKALISAPYTVWKVVSDVMFGGEVSGSGRPDHSCCRIAWDIIRRTYHSIGGNASPGSITSPISYIARSLKCTLTSHLHRNVTF